MNLTIFNTTPQNSNSIFACGLPMVQRTGLTSTQDKAERQQKAQSQIAFWENQKESLKNIECGTLEEIAQKLDKFHTYEDQIVAVKKQYNQEQMWHVMDEAKEIGEKIAEEAEKLEPKTAEERREDIAEEALGTDEFKGEMTEGIEEIQEQMAELSEEMQEQMTDMSEEIQEQMTEQSEEISRTTEEITDTPQETLDSIAEESAVQTDSIVISEIPADSVETLSEQAVEQVLKYKRIDVLI